MTLSEKCYRRFERKLRRLRSAYTDLAHRHDSDAYEISTSREDQTDDLASTGSLEQDALQLLSRDWSVITEIDEALKRLEDGEYGVCQLCDFGISRSRLSAIPYAKHCIRCETWLADNRWSRREQVG